ncbi:MAG TPA: hypothetical protein V6D47_14210, partial [Oscillatoriaceae cyanobacterium]
PLLALLTLVGCSSTPTFAPTARSGPPAIQANSVMHLGDTAYVNSTEDATVTITVTNTRTQQTSTTTSSIKQGNPLALPLDAAHLPGYDATQDFEPLKIDVVFKSPSDPDPSKGSTGSMTLDVVYGADVSEIPSIPYQLAPSQPTSGPLQPPGKGPVTITSTSDQADKLVNAIAGAWGLEKPSVSHTSVDFASVKIPSYLPNITADVPLLDYQIKGSFDKKYFIPADFAASGQDEVLTPNMLEAIVSETDPSTLVTLKAS